MALSPLGNVNVSADQLRDTFQKNGSPRIGITLGSGQGTVLQDAGSLEITERIPYSKIDSFPEPKVEGHPGVLLLGTIQGIPVAVLSGRVHLYEGHSPDQVVHAVRVLAKLGVSDMILTNAAGGVNTRLKVGDIMVINDHLNLMGANPLIGPNNDDLGPRFPAMAKPYPHWEALEWSRTNLNIQGSTGTYAAVTGPCYETLAETIMLRRLGADAVGMSTVPEAIALRHMGVRCGGISIITNAAGAVGLSHYEVKQVVAVASRRIAHLLGEIVVQINGLHQQ